MYSFYYILPYRRVNFEQIYEVVSRYTQRRSENMYHKELEPLNVDQRYRLK